MGYTDQNFTKVRKSVEECLYHSRIYKNVLEYVFLFIAYRVEFRLYVLYIACFLWDLPFWQEDECSEDCGLPR